MLSETLPFQNNMNSCAVIKEQFLHKLKQLFIVGSETQLFYVLLTQAQLVRTWMIKTPDLKGHQWINHHMTRANSLPGRINPLGFKRINLPPGLLCVTYFVMIWLSTTLNWSDKGLKTRFWDRAPQQDSAEEELYCPWQIRH